MTEKSNQMERNHRHEHKVAGRRYITGNWREYGDCAVVITASSC